LFVVEINKVNRYRKVEWNN